MRFFAVLSILISVAFGNDGHLQKAAVSPQQTTRPSDGRCELSAGFVHTPLMIAIWQGDLETVKKLVESGADLNAFFPIEGQDSTNVPLTTPLAYAIHAKNASYRCSHSDEMTEYLLAHKADPNLHARYSITPLQMASTFGDVASARILLKHKARLEERDYGGETALMIAAQRNNGFLVIQELVAAGADIHVVNDLGDNAIMVAAWQHHLDAVKLLVRLGVDACAKNNDGETAIDQAMSNLNNDPGKQEIISFLQEKCGH